MGLNLPPKYKNRSVFKINNRIVTKEEFDKVFDSKKFNTIMDDAMSTVDEAMDQVDRAMEGVDKFMDNVDITINGIDPVLEKASEKLKKKFNDLKEKEKHIRDNLDIDMQKFATERIKRKKPLVEISLVILGLLALLMLFMIMWTISMSPSKKTIESKPTAPIEEKTTQPESGFKKL